MANNPILSELYEIRSRILAEHPENLRDFLDDEQRRLESQGHPIAQIKQRSIQRTNAGKPAVPTFESPSAAPGISGGQPRAADQSTS